MLKNKINYDIEILRSFAIIIVLIEHMPTLFFWSQHQTFTTLSQYVQFWPGVDLFFCISGYVVGNSLISKVDLYRNCGDVGKAVIYPFFIKRAFRLLPSSLLWMCVILFCSYVYNRSGAFGRPSENIVFSLGIITYTYNLIFGYLLQIGYLPTYGPYWSLTLEEQFYFILPLFALLVRDKYRITFLLILFMSFFFIERQGTWLPSIRFDSILLGVVLSILHSKHALDRFKPVFLKSRYARLLINILLFGSLIIIPAALEKSRVLFGVLSLCCFAITFVASWNEGYILRHWSINAIMLWIAKRSYAIYLIHMPVIYFIQESVIRLFVMKGIAPHDSLPLQTILVLLCISLTLVLSDLNYRYLEKPLREKGRMKAEKMKNKIMTDEQIR
ncbi:acyltransferase [Erwinia billingiae]|uniref:acyltransferase family protein n=1 Tax=Erwinia billingiae TaxID=182337 RepID=UPI001247B8B8|nr:acyltransferase [Erwinia billingiae]QEW31525.1 acyltransferase [Erwinia billingiae]